MNFCVATIEFWNHHGFNTDDWRKSSDGLKALCHERFAETLIENIRANEDIIIFDIDSLEFQDVLKAEFKRNNPK